MKLLVVEDAGLGTPLPVESNADRRQLATAR